MSIKTKDSTVLRNKRASLNRYLQSNLELIQRHTFRTAGSDEPPVIALRLRRRDITANKPSRFVLIDQQDFFRWLEDGATPSLFLASSGKHVLARFKVPPGPPQNVSLGRYVANCDRGQNVKYLDGNPFNLRRSNVKALKFADSYDAILRRPRDVLRAYRECSTSMIVERDLGLYLINPEKLDLKSFTEKLT